MIKQIMIDDNNVVVGYCTGNGRVADGIDVTEIPPDYAPYKYMYVDGKYYLNPDYVEPTNEPTSDEPTAEELLDIFLGVDE